MFNFAAHVSRLSGWRKRPTLTNCFSLKVRRITEALDKSCDRFQTKWKKTWWHARATNVNSYFWMNWQSDLVNTTGWVGYRSDQDLEITYQDQEPREMRTVLKRIQVSQNFSQIPRVFTVVSDLGHFWEIIDSLPFVSWCGGHVSVNCLDYKALKRLGNV